MRKISSLFLIVMLLSGCAKLAHINELLTLKGVADEQASNDKIVKAYDAKFLSLVEAQKKDALGAETKKTILDKFTKPIYIESVDLEGVQVDHWVYRPYVQYFDSDQVHLYFNAEGKLIKSEFIPAPVKESKRAPDAQTSNPAP